MKDINQDTPPSSISGDEIGPMDDEIYFEEVEEISLDDEEMETDGYPGLEDIREPPEDHAMTVFNKHLGSVFCCDMHPEGKLAVSGGEDDTAYVWSIETGDVVFECTGHKDSVVFAGFSFDGVYLATGDMSGLIKVWKVNTTENQQQPWEAVFEHESEDLTWGQWHFGTRVLLTGTISGNIYVMKVPSGETKFLKGQNDKVECAKLFSDGVRLAVGYDNGVVKVWDLKTNAVVSQVPGTVHEAKVTALDVNPDNSLIISISSDGKVVLSTPSNGKVVSQLDGGKNLETVTFSHDPVGYFALGTLNGAVSLWDVSRQMLRHQCAEVGNGPEGVTQAIFIKEHLLTGLLDGSIKVYDSRSGQLVHTFTGHTSAILALSYNAKQNIIIASSDDDSARIYKYEFNKEKD